MTWAGILTGCQAGRDVKDACVSMSGLSVGWGERETREKGAVKLCKSLLTPITGCHCR